MEFDSINLLAIGLIFLGSYVQTAIGFGLAIVAAPLLILWAPEYVPAPICLVALFISLMNAMKHRSSVEIGGLKMALIGRVRIGRWRLATVFCLDSSPYTLDWFLVLFAVVVSVLPFRVEPTPARMTLAGFFSGLFGTSSAIGGPPMALLLQHQEANQLRGNLSAFLFSVPSFRSLFKFPLVSSHYTIW